LPRVTLAALFEQAARVQALLLAQLLIQPAAMPAQVEPDEWISAEQVSTRFGLDPQWLERHRRLLRSRKALSTPSRKQSLFHARRLARLLDDHTEDR
jgi:hypothetical protein